MAARTDAPPGAPFDHDGLAVRVLFGPGRVGALAEALDASGLERVLLIDGLEVPAVVAAVEDVLGRRRVRTLSRVRQHVPVEDAEAARALARELEVDGLVALGGGSATGLAKAIALTEALPIAAVPTTYAGSEMTAIWGMSENDRKTTGRSAQVAPRIVIYDPELTYSLPAGATAASGMNAVAHCVEALWTAAATPLTDAVATEGLALLAAGLRACVADPTDRPARATALRGAWLGGIALASAGTALHHKLCHVLGGFGMPHAEVHAALLPEVTALFAPVVPGAAARVADALGDQDAASGLRSLARELEATQTLADMGLSARQAREAAALAAAAELSSPRAVTEAEILDVLLAAGAPR